MKSIKNEILKIVFITFAGLLVLGGLIFTYLYFTYAKPVFDQSSEKNFIGWQNVSIEKVAKFRVPDEWIVTQENSVIYITDKPIDEPEYQIFLIGTSSWIGQEESEDIAPHELFEDVEYVGLVKSQVFSYGGMYGQNEYKIDNDIVTKSYVSYSSGNRNSAMFIAWDDLVDEETMIKIAESFRIEQ